MDRFEKRWSVVKQYCEKVNDYIISHPNTVLNFREESTPFAILLDEKKREASIRCGNCTFMIFNGDPEWDEGAHTPIKELKRSLKRDLVIYRKVRI